MPIHDLGYRAWKGRPTPALLRWCVIAENGIALAWQNRWLRRVALVAWLPMLYFGITFFAYEAYVEQWVGGQLGARGPWTEILRNFLPLPRDLLDRIFGDPLEARSRLWTMLLFLFFRFPQAGLLAVAVGLIAPPLIARDIRSRAFILYFSRPITRIEYVLGKASVIWAYSIWITTLPALALYVLAVLLSPSLSVVLDTWDLPLRVIGATAVLLVPTTCVALMLSSLVTETRYATFCWFTLWILGGVAFLLYQRLHGVFHGRGGGLLAETDTYWVLISLFDTLGQVQKWVFSVGEGTGMILPLFVYLVLVTAGSLAVVMWKVSSPMRA